mmetsp:Transcript_585/g.813  ORF Transcript_585/g.813 Transcript_585/m.813 type:complete len:283 (+) Transcript_585:180-1028(+)
MRRVSNTAFSSPQNMSATSRKTSASTPLAIPIASPSSLDHHRQFSSHRYTAMASRLTDLGQMDVQAALDQMRSLLSGRPQIVYKTAYYRKQTKNHWARDDPAFSALQVGFLVVAALAYSVAFRTTIMGGLSFLLYSLLWNWLVPGIIVATIGRELANRHLAGTQSSTHVKQSVEWLYAFDIHCNSFFPMFCLLYVAQFFLLPLVLSPSLFALLLSNTLYAAAFSWYWYITHLGYRSLPFLSNTEVFLFPVAAIALVYVLNLVGYPFGMGWNASRLLAQVYFY